MFDNSSKIQTSHDSNYFETKFFFFYIFRRDFQTPPAQHYFWLFLTSTIRKMVDFQYRISKVRHIIGYLRCIMYCGDCILTHKIIIIFKGFDQSASHFIEYIQWQTAETFVQTKFLKSIRLKVKQCKLQKERI